jgi:hypothetical protein
VVIWGIVRRLLLRIAVTALVPLLAAPACGGRERADVPALRALDRALAWLAAHRPDPARALLGELGTDAWTWSMFAHLHPDEEVRRRAGQEARARFGAIEPRVEPSETSLTYWSLILREMRGLGMDTAQQRAALERLDLEAALDRMTGTSAFWTRELLRRGGIQVTVDSQVTVLAERAAAGTDGYQPSLRDAYAIYHEIAPAADLGREPPRAFTAREIAFAREASPRLLEVSRRERDLDAAAEVLTAAAILGQRDQPWHREALAWLIGVQREDGTWPDLRNPTAQPGDSRHAVLVASSALLQSLAGEPGAPAAVSP